MASEMAAESCKKTDETKIDPKLKQLEDAFAKRLPNAVMGEVVTRFPPEPSGYLHIGHAKAAMINSFYANYFKGKLLIRFDDTNPSREKADFAEAILEDLKLLGIKETKDTSYTSDYFPQLLEAMEKMLNDGLAYVDDTNVDKMREERFKGIESKCRNQSIEENIRRWKEMIAGSEEGQTMCVRAKINMTDKNKCMRDPVMYRVNVQVPHHRTGSKFKVYPCYDFACPLVDSWSGVTHTLRTNEYADRIPQYYWVQDTCKVRRTIIYEFSRLNFTNTVLSKRKLQWLVDTGVVEGWDDPRFPTVRGLRRRGLQISSLHEFLMEQGPSKNANLMEWDKLWSKNTKHLDLMSKRFMAVREDAVKVVFTNFSSEDGKIRKRPLHQKCPELGEIDMQLTETVLLDLDDLVDSVDGEEVTLMKIGNIIFKEIVRQENGEIKEIKAELNLGGDVKKTKKKVHWVSYEGAKAGPAVKFILREYDHVIVKRKPEEGDDMESLVNRKSELDTICLAEAAVGGLKEDEIVQFERRGYCRVDRIDSKTGLRIMISIPSGKMKAMSSISTKVDAASLVKGGALPQ